MTETLGQETSQQKKNELPVKTYQRGVEIRVTAREVLPSNEIYNSEEAVVFFQGWGPKPDAPSYGPLTQSIADCFSRRVILVNTQPKETMPDSLNHEANAARQYVEELKIKNAIAAGYSEGGALATNFAAHCQRIRDAATPEKRDEKINPEALILLAPVGLHNLDELLVPFLVDTGLKTGIRILTSASSPKAKKESNKLGKIGRALQAGQDVVAGAIKEAVETGVLEYPERLKAQIEEMKRLNPRLAEIKTPVFLIQGKHDLPAAPHGALQKGQMARQDPEGEVEKALKELFPNSPHVKRVLAERDSNHVFPLLRGPQIARVSEYLLERSKRQE